MAPGRRAAGRPKTLPGAGRTGRRRAGRACAARVAPARCASSSDALGPRRRAFARARGARRGSVMSIISISLSVNIGVRPLAMQCVCSSEFRGEAGVLTLILPARGICPNFGCRALVNSKPLARLKMASTADPPSADQLHALLAAISGAGSRGGAAPARGRRAPARGQPAGQGICISHGRVPNRGFEAAREAARCSHAARRCERARARARNTAAHFAARASRRTRPPARSRADRRRVGCASATSRTRTATRRS